MVCTETAAEPCEEALPVVHRTSLAPTNLGCMQIVSPREIDTRSSRDAPSAAPVMVTGVPPVTGPAAGEIDEMRGCAKRVKERLFDLRAPLRSSIKKADDEAEEPG